eukprot:UN24916
MNSKNFIDNAICVSLLELITSFDEKICRFSLVNSNHSFEVGFHYCVHAFFINMRQRERIDVKHANSEKKKCVAECEDTGREWD